MWIAFLCFEAPNHYPNILSIVSLAEDGIR